MIETETRKIWNEAAEKAAKETALRLLQIGKLTTEEVAIGSGLTVEEVKKLEKMATAIPLTLDGGLR